MRVSRRDIAMQKWRLLLQAHALFAEAFTWGLAPNSRAQVPVAVPSNDL